MISFETKSRRRRVVNNVTEIPTVPDVSPASGVRFLPRLTVTCDFGTSHQNFGDDLTNLLSRMFASGVVFGGGCYFRLNEFTEESVHLSLNSSSANLLAERARIRLLHFFLHYL